MSNSQNSQSDFVKRYMALKAIRDNILYTEPMTDTAASAIEDIPGPARSLAAPLAEPLAARAIISSDPEIRRTQIAEAIKKVRAARGDSDARNEQMLTNALRLGGVSAPVGAVAGGLLAALGKGRLPIGRGGFKNPFPNAGANLKNLFIRDQVPTRAQKFIRSAVLRDTRKGAIESGALGAIAGAGGGAFAGTAKPSDEDIDAAGKILQEHPYASALPGGEAASVFDSYDPTHNRLNAALVGGGLGAAAAVPATLLPPTLESGGIAAGNILNRAKNSLFANSATRIRNPLFLHRLMSAARKNLLGNALALGGLGSIGGYAASNHDQNAG
jgi:hypothetical protein